MIIGHLVAMLEILNSDEMEEGGSDHQEDMDDVAAGNGDGDDHGTVE